MNFDWNKHLQNAIDFLSQRLNININNKILFYEALTHKSFLYFYPNYPYSYNERLEFLGDAILEFLVSLHLFKKYPNFQEGELTLIRASLINRDKLADIALDLGLDKCILIGRNINEKGLRTVLSNTFEAIIGAIFLDNNLEVVEKIIVKYVLKDLDEIVKRGLYKDPKSVLQEILQEKYQTLPNYVLIKEEGPAHKKIFTVGVYLNEKLLSVGEGTNKQEAEIKAAEKALKKILNSEEKLKSYNNNK